MMSIDLGGKKGAKEVKGAKLETWL